MNQEEVNQLNQLAANYARDYPESENPIRLTYSYSEEEILKMLIEANGREIVFKDIEGTIDGITYEFIEPGDSIS